MLEGNNIYFLEDMLKNKKHYEKTQYIFLNNVNITFTHTTYFFLQGVENNHTKI